METALYALTVFGFLVISLIGVALFPMVLAVAGVFALAIWLGFIPSIANMSPELLGPLAIISMLIGFAASCIITFGREHGWFWRFLIWLGARAKKVQEGGHEDDSTDG